MLQTAEGMAAGWYWAGCAEHIWITRNISPPPWCLHRSDTPLSQPSSEVLTSPLISWQLSCGSGSSLLVASAGVYVQEEHRDSDSQHRQTRAEVTAELVQSHRQLLLATAVIKCHHLKMSLILFNSDGYILGALCYYSAFSRKSLSFSQFL